MVREVRDMQCMNACSPMIVTESPVVSEARDMQPRTCSQRTPNGPDGNYGVPGGEGGQGSAASERAIVDGSY